MELSWLGIGSFYSMLDIMPTLLYNSHFILRVLEITLFPTAYMGKLRFEVFTLLTGPDHMGRMKPWSVSTSTLSCCLPPSLEKVCTPWTSVLPPLVSRHPRPTPLYDNVDSSESLDWQGPVSDFGIPRSQIQLCPPSQCHSLMSSETVIRTCWLLHIFIPKLQYNAHFQNHSLTGWISGPQFPSLCSM
jgi:hypothetical protein